MVNIIILLVIACLFVLAIRVARRHDGCPGCGKCGRSDCLCPRGDE